MADDAERRQHADRRRDVTRGGRRITDLASHPHAYVRVGPFAHYLDVTGKLVRKWIRAGALPATNFEGRWRIKKSDALAFEKANRFDVPVSGAPLAPRVKTEGGGKVAHGG
jgi:excisionase family DNA binding protein